MAREVLPYVPDAWVDEAKTKIGYEINFNSYFYTYVPPRPLAEIEADIRALETEIVRMLGEITGSGVEKAGPLAPPQAASPQSQPGGSLSVWR